MTINCHRFFPQTWRIFIIVVLCGSGVFALLSITRWLLDPERHTSANDVGLPSPMTVFTSEHFPISIQYPKNWIAFELLQGDHGDLDVITAIGTRGRAPDVYVRIAHKTFPDGRLEDVAQWGIERKVEAETRRGYTALETRGLDSIGLQGISHEYSYTSESPFYGRQIIRCLDWYVMQNGYGYALTFCANQDHWPQVYPVFLEMIESFTAE